MFLLLVSFVSCNEDDEMEKVVNPNAAFIYEISSNNPLEVNFTSTVTDRKSIKWDFGDGTTETIYHPTHVYDEAGTYTVILTAYGQEGSSPAVFEETITLEILDPTATFSYSTSIDDPLEFTFTSNTTYATSFYWDFGDGQSSTLENPVHAYSEEGPYVVSLTVNGFQGTTPAVVSETVYAGGSPFDGGLIDMTNWTVQEVSPGVTVSISSNSINFQGVGGWAGSHIYQEVTVEAGTYLLSGSVTVNSVIDETWSELIFSDQQPQPGQDFVPGIPYQVVYSTWNGSPTEPGTYDLAEANAGGEYPVDGLYTFDTPETFYIVIKSGSNQPYDLTWNELSFKKVVDTGLIDMTNWTVQEVAPGVSVDIMDGLTETAINFQGIGGWAGSHIYQEVTVEAGTYHLSGSITVNSVIDETWSELIFSTVQPQAGQDYAPGIPYQVVYSTWNGSPTTAGTYDLGEANAGGEYPVDGIYTFDAPETFYIVIKSGSNQPYDLTWNNLSFVQL